MKKERKATKEEIKRAEWIREIIANLPKEKQHELLGIFKGIEIAQAVK